MPSGTPNSARSSPDQAPTAPGSGRERNRPPSGKPPCAPSRSGRIRDVDPDLSERCRTIDPAVLGPRVRSARLRAGLTQTDAAGGEMSTAYVSRIEAGQRRPDPALLLRLAARLGTTVEELVTGVGPQQEPELRTRLTWADLALTSGDLADAEAHLDDAAGLLAGLDDDTLPDVRREALVLRARLREALGDLDGAILLLEDLTARGAEDLGWLELLTALSRCYREAGDLARAVEVGERAAGVLDELGLGGSDEAIALTVTVAAAHFERGDVAHAARMCRRAIDLAERLDSPRARASAYWNASVIESQRGRPAAAMPLARHALALLQQASGGRNQARLRSHLGLMHLKTDPPDPDAAFVELRQAEDELRNSDASTVDLALNQVWQARACLLQGRHDEAAARAHEVLGSVGDSAPLVAADAHVLVGEVALHQGHAGAARAAFQRAVMALSAAGADRQVAQLWFDLGGLLEGVGEADLALDAFRRAAASTGLQTSHQRLHA